MVATGLFALKSNQHRDFSTMADVLASTGSFVLRMKKDILVQNNEVSDIIEKFIKVAHGHEALENNRARENARENIRKKLALEEAKEKSDSCDLQLCFVNEFASDEDLSEGKEDAEHVAMALEDIAKANISKRKSQIIVPINPAATQSSPTTASLSPPQDDATHRFKTEVSRLQGSAQDSLKKARDKARVNIQDQINTRHQTNQKLFSLVGLTQFSKVKLCSDIII